MATSNHMTSKLTIAIPTYNRAKSLRRSLGTIIRQVSEIKSGWDLIEVIVSDNCSTDETENVVREVAQGHAVKYWKNSSNLGMEGNFLKCFEAAQGIHVWTFSDDDILLDGVLQKVLDLITENPVDLVYLRPKFLYGELESFATDSVNFNFNRVTREYFALRANGLLSFLSAVIVNRSRYLNLRRDDNLRRYAGTWLAHYEWIYTLMSDGEYFYVADRPVIRARTGVTGGYDIFEVFGKFYTAIGNEKLPNRPRMRRDLECTMLYMHIPGFITRCRANSFGKFQYVPARISEQILNSYGNSLFYRLVIHNQLFGGEFAAAIAYRISQVYSRCWIIFRRLMSRSYHFQ